MCRSSSRMMLDSDGLRSGGWRRRRRPSRQSPADGGPVRRPSVPCPAWSGVVSDPPTRCRSRCSLRRAGRFSRALLTAACRARRLSAAASRQRSRASCRLRAFHLARPSATSSASRAWSRCSSASRYARFCSLPRWRLSVQRDVAQVTAARASRAAAWSRAAGPQGAPGRPGRHGRRPRTSRGGLALAGRARGRGGALLARGAALGLLARNGAAHWLSPPCRSAGCSKRALRSRRVQFAKSDLGPVYL